MNMLVQYDAAMSALSTALNSRDVSIVLKGRDDLEHIKLRAKQVRDRQLLADATEFQMRVERWLGVLLQKAKEAGHLRDGRPGKVPEGETAPASLKDIGVDKKLSMKAQQAAALNKVAFDRAISEMREHMASGRAKHVSSISARHSPSIRKNCYSFPLADGTALGQVKLGKIRSRVESLIIELRILKAISERIGAAADALASVEDSIGAPTLDQIIKKAEMH